MWNLILNHYYDAPTFIFIYIIKYLEPHRTKQHWLKGLIPGYEIHVLSGLTSVTLNTIGSHMSEWTKSDIPYLNTGACEPDLRRDL